MQLSGGSAKNVRPCMNTSWMDHHSRQDAVHSHSPLPFGGDIAAHVRAEVCLTCTGDGKCVVCDSYVRPCTLVRICDECNYGSYAGRCVICGGIGISDAYYCKECTVQEKDVGRPAPSLVDSFCRCSCCSSLHTRLLTSVLRGCRGTAAQRL